MTAYQPEQWHDLFVAMAGAAAALTGLVFGLSALWSTRGSCWSRSIADEGPTGAPF
jgi:hypothetical protein